MKNRRLKRNQAYNVIDACQRNEYMTAEDLAHELGLHYKIAERHLRECWALNLIYIASWDRKHHHHVPVYRWGAKQDAAKPKPLTKAEVYAREKESQRRERKCSRLPA